MRVDVHAHYQPKEYFDMLACLGTGVTPFTRNMRAGADPADLAARLQIMTDAGVQMQVLSVAGDLPYFEREADAITAARLANDLFAGLVTRYSDRFAAFATMPLPHVDASLEEVARALDTLGMVGVTVATSVLARSLVDPDFEPLYAELNRRAAVLFVHPAGVGACSPLIQPYRLTWPIGAPIEDTVAVMHLILRGIPTRYPKIKIIISHLGGALPMLLLRLDDHARSFLPVKSEPPSITARRLWYDTVGHGHIPALRCAYDSLGADRLLLGSDYPYQQGEKYRRAVSYVQEAGLPEEDVEQILDRNAAGLLGLEPRGGQAKRTATP